MRQVHALILLSSLLGCLLSSSLSAAENISIRLPSKADLANLSDLVANAANVSIKYDTQKLRGSVRLNIQKELNAQELWEVYNQVLISQQYATVVTGTPAVYHVVPFNEAAMLSSMITKEQVDALTYKPSYLVVVHQLAHIPPDQAVKAASSVFFGNQAAQARTFGQDDSRMIVAGVRAMVEHALQLIAKLDQAEAAPLLRSYEPRYATPQSLLSASMAAWTALNRMSPGKYSGELQLTPDNARLLLIASQKHIDALEKLVSDLDVKEPLSSKSYTPRFFTIDDVADLIEQIFASEQGSKQPNIIRDNLTNALIIKATEGQHARIKALLERLDNVPPESQQSMKTFVIKNRSATELVTILSNLLQSDQDDKSQRVSENNNRSNNAANNTATTTTNQNTANANNATNTNNNTSSASANTAPSTTNNAASANNNNLVAASNGPSVRLTTDEHTNSIIAISTPQQLAHVEQIIKQLDLRQPQVQLEIIMVNLSDTKTKELGVELAHQFEAGGSTHNLFSLFGLSKDLAVTPAATATPPDSFAGFAGTVVNPGNFAAMIRALETVTKGKGIIRSNAVVGNNAESLIDSVREEPVTNFNAGDRFSTTTFSGTLDAGTEIRITPQISAADYITLNYEISQSAFLGETTITADGGTVPPPKRKDSLTSIATIPDGHVIALGGLTEEIENESISKVPILGSIPLLGMLFRSKVKSIDQSTFHIFIKATILRNENFETLKHRSAAIKKEADIDDDEWPTLKPRIIR